MKASSSPGVETADGRVVDREVEDGEEVAVVAVVVAGVDVDLRALAPREDVLDVERVPAEAAGEKLRLAGGRGEEVDPGDAAGAGAQPARAASRRPERPAQRGANGCEAGWALVLRGSAVAGMAREMLPTRSPELAT